VYWGKFSEFVREGDIEAIALISAQSFPSYQTQECTHTVFSLLVVLIQKKLYLRHSQYSTYQVQLSSSLSLCHLLTLVQKHDLTSSKSHCYQFPKVLLTNHSKLIIFEQKFYSLAVLENRNLQSRCLQGWFLPDSEQASVRCLSPPASGSCKSASAFLGL
jgi:hypothetical protein